MAPEMRKMAALLYPIAMLTATMDPKVGVPSPDLEQKCLESDVKQFVNEPLPKGRGV